MLNRSKREEAESEPLNSCWKTKGTSWRGLVATFWKLVGEYLLVERGITGTRNWFKNYWSEQKMKPRIETSSFCCEYLPVSSARFLSKPWLQGLYLGQDYPLHRAKILHKRICDLDFFSLERNLAKYQKRTNTLSCKMVESFCYQNLQTDIYILHC